MVNLEERGKKGERERERKGKEYREGRRERERKREMSPEQIPKDGHPWPGSPFTEKAQLVSQASLC
jgi:hypothetical protein